jgi:hypothetical protein
LGDTATLVTPVLPSSTNCDTQRRMRQSHVCTTPSSQPATRLPSPVNAMARSSPGIFRFATHCFVRADTSTAVPSSP